MIQPAVGSNAAYAQVNGASPSLRRTRSGLGDLGTASRGEGIDGTVVEGRTNGESGKGERKRKDWGPEASEEEIGRQPEDEDIILPIKKARMEEIINGSRTHEHRKVRFKATVKRAWFYLIAPDSSIMYLSHIGKPLTRGEGQLPEEGLDNREFNLAGEDSDFPKHAYAIHSVYKLTKPIPWAELQERYNVGTAPKAGVYLSQKLLANVPWDQQEKIWEQLDD